MFLHKPGFLVNLESGKFGMGGFVQQDLCSGDILFSFILFRGFRLKTYCPVTEIVYVPLLWLKLPFFN